MKSKPILNIYQNRRGITFLDGYYLIRNPTNKAVAIISIAQGIVSVHEVKSQMSLQDLINRDTLGYLDVFEALKPMESDKQKPKQENDD